MPARGNQTRTLTLKGRTQTLQAWAAELGLSSATLRARIDRLGWPVEKALTTPPDRKLNRSPGRPAKGAPRRTPQLKRHARGQAYVKWMEAGVRHHRYFGPWGSQKARDGYGRFLREWSEGLTQKPSPAGETHGSIGALVGLWLDHAKAKYRKFGKTTSEYHCHRAACGVLLELFSDESAADFGLVELETVRREMVAGRKWARKTVNKHITRLVACFGWGVPRKLVPGEVHYALTQVEPLAPGASAAAESAPVRSVPLAHIEAVLAGEHLHPDPARRAVLAAMIRVQLLTGMRPNEVCAMRPEHLDTSGSEWRYAVPPQADKNYHRDRPRPPVWLGPGVQGILAPLLSKARSGGHAVFAYTPKRKIADGLLPITRDWYGRYVARACKSAKVPPWHPHQLRHNRATELKRRYESDAKAARGIGASEDVTARIYADPQESVDRRIARETG